MGACSGPFINQHLVTGFNNEQLALLMQQVINAGGIEHAIYELVDSRCLKLSDGKSEWLDETSIPEAVLTTKRCGASAPYSMYDAFEGLHVLLPNSSTFRLNTTLPWADDAALELYGMDYDDAIARIEYEIEKYAGYSDAWFADDGKDKTQLLTFSRELLADIKTCAAANVCFMFGW